MAINATHKQKEGSNISPIEPGTYLARCYSMVHIGTNEEVIQGETKTLNKVRIGWELPTELHVFKEENGEQPRVISQEYTLSMYEKSKLRPMLEAWRGKAFTEQEAENFDVSKLLGVPCFITIVNQTSKKGNIYAKIAGVSSLPKGTICPEQINKTFLLDYDNFSMELANSLPDFIQEKIFSSIEFNDLMGEAQEEEQQANKQELDADGQIIDDDLPF